MGNIASSSGGTGRRRHGGRRSHPPPPPPVTPQPDITANPFVYPGAAPYPAQYPNPNPPLHYPHFHYPAYYPPPPPVPLHHHPHMEPGWNTGRGYPCGPVMTPPAPYVEHQKAVTIRNDVNIKKETLKVEPDEENPGRFLVSFTFDATVPGW